jgi:hypothetical protein
MGPEPRDQAQQTAWRQARTAISRVHAKQRTSDRTRGDQPTRTQAQPIEPTQQDSARTRPGRELGRGRAGPERAAG